MPTTTFNHELTFKGQWSRKSYKTAVTHDYEEKNITKRKSIRVIISPLIGVRCMGQNLNYNLSGTVYLHFLDSVIFLLTAFQSVTESHFKKRI